MVATTPSTGIPLLLVIFADLWVASAITNGSPANFPLMEFPTRESCVLPKFPKNGRWNPNCRKGACPQRAEGEKVPLEFQITYSCDEGFSLQGLAVKDCINGTWVPWKKPTCSAKERIYAYSSISYTYNHKPVSPSKEDQQTEESCGDFWPCRKGLQCIDPEAVCDGQVDCPDKSDEASCPVISNNGWCTLPSFPEHGRWIPNCRTNECPPSAEGDNVPHGFKITYSCFDGFAVHGLSTRVCTNDGTWYPQQPTNCSDHCLVQASPKLHVTCFHKGEFVDCRKPVPPLSEARFRCRDATHYLIAGAQVSRSRCIAGKWTTPFPDSICKPKCGRLVTGTSQTFIVNGEPVKRSMFPWHAGIYIRNFNNTREVEFVVVCGGSLISDQVLLSAAHCFLSDGPDRRFLIKTDLTNMKVGLGKHYSDLNDVKDVDQQILDIERVVPHPDYTGLKDNFAFDIALVFLARPATINFAVQPVCMDVAGDSEWDQLSAGRIGLVAGWGVTDVRIRKPSEELRVAKIPFVDRWKCLMKTNIFTFVTGDKICGGVLNKSAPIICSGDSGGGYVFADEINNVFYLRGIVSGGDGECAGKDFNLFTRVSKHASFIDKNWHY